MEKDHSTPQPEPGNIKQPPKEFRVRDAREAEKSETTGKKSPKWPIVVILTLFVIFAAVIAFLLLRPSPQTPEVIQEEGQAQQESAAPVDTSSIQAGVGAWVGSMNTQGNMFGTQEICDAEGMCEMSDPQPSVIALWGLYKWASVSENTQSAQEAIATLSATPSSEDPWSCHFLYDIASASQAVEGEIAGMQQVCQSHATQVTSQVTLQEITAKLQEIMNRELPPNEAAIFQEGSTETFETLAARASANAVNVIWNEADMQAALGSFDEALAYYAAGDEEATDKAALLSLAALDMHQATQDAIFLEFAEYLYNVHINPVCVSLARCANFLYLTHELEKITQGQQYAQYSILLTQSILEKSYDSAQHANILGKNALYTTEGDNIVYPTRENALILGTFAQN